jgi:hypothetical protein
MKRFRFSLEKVLRLRSQETEQAKRALAVALAAEARARQTAAEAYATLRDRTTEATARERLGLTAYEFGSLRTFLARLQREAVAADLAVTQAEERTQRQRMADGAGLLHGRDDRDLPERRQRVRERPDAVRSISIVVGDQNARHRNRQLYRPAGENRTRMNSVSSRTSEARPPVSG